MSIKAEAFIVIVTYNSSDFIEKCINSICDSDYKKWVLAVVDNNSSDDTVKKIQALKKEKDGGRPGKCNFTLIALKKNIGFAAAVNFSVFNFLYKSVRQSNIEVKYLILVNPDLVLEKSSLSNLIEALGKENDAGLNTKKIGAAGGIIYDYEKKYIQNAGGMLLDNFITQHIQELPENISVNEPYFTDYTSGAFLGIKIKYFKGLGGFDSGYRPLYFEELDFCLKLKKAGLFAAVVPDVFARHFEGASVKKFSSSFYMHYHKNRIRCALINIRFMDFFKKFIPYEIKWLKEKATYDQKSAIIRAYFLNFLFFLYNLAVRLKNWAVLSGFKRALKA